MKYISITALIVTAFTQIACKNMMGDSSPDGVVSKTTLSPAARKKLPPAPLTGPEADSTVTHSEFAKRTTYKSGNEVWENTALASKPTPAKRLEIDTNTQRGILYVENQVAMDFPLTTGRAGKRTPKGSFSITQKQAAKRSTLYGSFVDRKNRIVRGGVRVTDRRPSGTRFRGAKLPYWMRFNGSVGLHQGGVHRVPASNGCVRVPPEVAPLLFNRLSKGADVIVR